MSRGGNAATWVPSGLPTRAFTPEERGQLLRRFRATGPRVLRVLGIIFGLGAVFLGLAYFFGADFDPNVVSWEVLIVGAFSVGCVGAGSSQVRDLRAALEAGTVAEVSGPVAPLGAGPPGLSQFEVGPVQIQLPDRRSVNIVPNLPCRITMALGLRATPPKAARDTFPNRGLLISVNGSPQSPAPVVYWKVVGSAAASNPATPAIPGAPSAPGAPAGAAIPAAIPSPAITSPGDGLYCDKCGHQNPAGFAFCRRCGSPRTS